MAGKLGPELRWFFKGVIPSEVREWFSKLSGGDRPLKEKNRKDLYLIVADRVDLGLKISRGSLELKWRQDAHPLFLSGSGLIGVKEIWRKEKWYYAKKFTDELLMAFGQPHLKGRRSEVAKTRLMHKLQVDASGELRALAAGEKPACLLQVELTSLTKHDRPWWTLCLEMAGEPDHLSEVFAGAVEKILHGHPQLDLQASRSYGYPQWLALSD
jgi:hypothetical protein